jgi:uncharacterized protein (DUF302 family)
MTEYGYTVEIPEGYDEAITRTRLALRAEGFSVLTEAHVAEVMSEHNPGGRQYLIMGAWNSPTTQTIGDSNVKVGVHLPCNVVVHETGRAAIVAALDPADTVDAVDAASQELVDSARSALHRVLQRVATGL